MKGQISDIFALKTNVIGTVLIAVAASVLTTVTSHFFLTSQPASSPPVTQPALSASGLPSVLDCPEGVYSPVQRTCVTQEVFDAEMQRLFAALGINTSAYGLGQNEKE